jgi:hypothetical protein
LTKKGGTYMVNQILKRQEPIRSAEWISLLDEAVQIIREKTPQFYPMFDDSVEESISMGLRNFGTMPWPPERLKFEHADPSLAEKKHFFPMTSYCYLFERFHQGERAEDGYWGIAQSDLWIVATLHYQPDSAARKKRIVTRVTTKLVGTSEVVALAIAPNKIYSELLLAINNCVAHISQSVEPLRQDLHRLRIQEELLPLP